MCNQLLGFIIRDVDLFDHCNEQSTPVLDACIGQSNAAYADVDR
jgi:hypothetical protein